MEQLTPIPTPTAQRLREFRIQVLPIATFLAVLAGVVTLWHRYVMPSNIVAEVEAVRANIITVVPGTLKELKVERFQRVTKGQELAVISTSDGDALKAGVAAIQADLRVLKARMRLDVERNNATYEENRLEYLRERVDLAVKRADLKYWEYEVKRNRALLTATPPLVSASEFEWFQQQAESTRVSVEEGERYLAEKEKTLPKLQPSASDLANDPISEAIRAQEEKLRLTSEPISLKAPFDGMVSAVNHRAGERVAEGAPIIVLSAIESDRIVGFIRQPIIVRPKAGDVVQIRRRSFQRELKTSTVLEVGSQLEVMPSTLLATDARAGREVGLPFLVKVPQGMNLLPGESVDLLLNDVRPRAQ